jgi:ribosomal protein S27E
MGIWKKLFGGSENREERKSASSPRAAPRELNAAPRLGSVHYDPSAANLMKCQDCGSQVVVDKRKPVTTVYCLECAMEIARKSNLKTELRVPID